MSMTKWIDIYLWVDKTSHLAVGKGVLGAAAWGIKSAPSWRLRRPALLDD